MCYTATCMLAEKAVAMLVIISIHACFVYVPLNNFACTNSLQLYVVCTSIFHIIKSFIIVKEGTYKYNN